MIGKVQRTTLAPLAMQLENAERYLQQAAETTAAAAGKAMPADIAVDSGFAVKGPSLTLDNGTVPDAVMADQQGGQRGQQSPYTNAETFLSASHDLQQGGNFSTGGVLPASTSAMMPTLEDDDMLQAEMAFLGLTSGTASAPDNRQHGNLS